MGASFFFFVVEEGRQEVDIAQSSSLSWGLALS